MRGGRGIGAKKRRAPEKAARQIKSKGKRDAREKGDAAN
jgi:hypothetical protein